VTGKKLAAIQIWGSSVGLNDKIGFVKSCEARESSSGHDHQNVFKGSNWYSDTFLEYKIAT
jgi:hypothetical protein